MNLLSAENLSVSFGDRLLFENLSFGIDKGDRIALIASNGTGKTTLLNILAGLELPDTGSVVLREGVRIGYLRQDPFFDKSLSVQESIRKANEYIVRIIRSYEKAVEKQAADFSVQSQREVEELFRTMEMLDAWNYERRMIQILSKLQITNLEQTIGELSGGQVKRLALAAVLIDSPDILLLDEPTNHMDIEMIEWLEEFLSQPGKTIFMVSHDRYFLDNVCTRIIEMEDQTIYHHRGSYLFYLEKSQARKEVSETEFEKVKQLYKKELEWMRTQPRARTHKSKSRVDSFYDIEKKAKSGRAKKELRLDMKMQRMGSKIMEMRNVCKKFDDQIILDNFSYTFKKGDRIGVVGNNGSGKTTFLNILHGEMFPDAGKIIPGDTIRIGYFRQDDMQFDESGKVIDVVKDIAEDIILSDGKRISASQFLDFFLFPPKMQQNFVSKLSGGEKRRLQLLTVLIKNPNFLILDEPTNDLDLPTLNTIEEFLLKFGGCLVLVSHDRYILDTLTDHIFVFEGDGKITDFYDTYSAWRLKKQKLQKVLSNEIRQEKVGLPVAQSEITGRRKPSWKEKREFEVLESELEQLEREKLALEADMQQFSSDSEKIFTLSGRYAAVIQLIDEKTLRWLELSEICM